MSRKATQEMTVMNVRELIEALESLDDKSLTVVLEGCDCSNDASGVAVIPATAAGAYRARPAYILIEADV